MSASADPAVDIVNRSRVTGTTPDTDLDNNTSDNVARPTAIADLSILKTLDRDLVPGGTAVYRMRIANAGPSDAQSVRITDPLPEGITFVSAASSTEAGVFGVLACTPDADTANTAFTCNLDRAMPPGAFSIVDVTVRVAEGVVGDRTNTATVTSPTDPTDSSSSVTNGSDPQADLGIVKTRPAGNVIAGNNVTWTLTVTNNGLATSAADIVVTDPLPDTLDFVSVDGGPDWACAFSADAPAPGSSGMITCTRSTPLLASTAGGSNVAPPITLVARVRPGTGQTTIFNTATVTATTPDRNPDNNQSTSVVPVIVEGDVQIVKTPETQTVRAGENGTFALTITNNGPSTVRNLVIEDLLPSGMTVVSATSADAACVTPTGVTVRCLLGSLDPTDPVTGLQPTVVVDVVAKVGSGEPTGAALMNLATVSTTTPETNTANNFDTAVTNVISEADLGVAKSHPIDPVIAGDRMTFEIVVSNFGPSDAPGPIVVTDTLPPGFRYLGVDGPWRCAPRADSDPQVVDCTFGREPGATPGLIGGTLETPTVAPSMLMTVQLDPSLDPSDTAGIYDNVASIDYPTDPNPDNNSVTDPVTVVTSANLSIVKSHDPDSVRIGDDLVFTLRVENEGLSEARGVRVTDTLPEGLTFVSAAGALEASAWDCTASAAPNVDCVLTGPLPAPSGGEPSVAEDILVTATVEPGAFPQVENTGVVESDTPDSNPDDNTSTDIVDVPRLVDLFIEKTHTEPVKVGEPLVFTLLVGNKGPIDDDAVITVVDELPEGLDLTDAASDVAKCEIDGNVVTCTKDDGLGVDETFEITVTASVLPVAYPGVTNTATVSSPTDDNDTTNNSASDAVTVPPLVDLGITKTHAGPVKVGGQITFTVTVVNNGPTPDPGPVRMLDTLPGSLTPVSAEADGMTCDITGQTVACQAIDAVDVDEELVITIVADVGAGAVPTVENTAIVTTPGCVVGPADEATEELCPDTDLGNNTDTDVAEVAPLVRLGVDKTLSTLQGSTATWSVVVSNEGPNDTVDPILVTDRLPTALVFVSANGTGWVCSEFSQIVGCTYDEPVAAGASAPPINIVTRVNAAAGTVITNLVTAEGGAPDVPKVTDDASVAAPKPKPIANTGGGPGVLMVWAPLLLLAGAALLLVSRRRRNQAVT